MTNTMHVVATAGHVDHGKSTLVKALTGTDPDRFAEERRRGLTIDLGFAWMSLPKAGSVAFVDVPGHIRFISNMLAGVAVVEAGLLCVDAREGWRAQTEDHLRILDLVGLPAGLVAITKTGLVDADQLAAVRDEVARRTAGTVLDGAPVVACDAVDGTGLDDLRDSLDTTLAARPPAADNERPRLWVDRSFTIAGAGTVVTGGVGHGAFAKGDPVVSIGASGEVSGRVRGIQALGRRVASAPAGSRAALNLGGLNRRDIRRGDAVVRPGEWSVTAVADATLAVLPTLDHDVTRRGAYLAYLGTGEHALGLRLLETQRLSPGSTGAVRLTLEHPLPLAAGDRYVLRETGRSEIVGGGELLDLDPPRRARFRSRLSEEHDWMTAAEVERRFGIAVEPVVGEWVVSPSGLQAATDSLRQRIEVARPIGLDVALLDKRDRAVLTLLEDDHAAETVAGFAVAPAWRDDLAQHPFVVRLERDLFTPPLPEEMRVPPDILRALLRRDLILVKNGLYFAASVRTEAPRLLTKLSQPPEGFTVGEAREALGTTRKWAVPLLELLDEARITVRQGDRRRLAPSAGRDSPEAMAHRKRG